MAIEDESTSKTGTVDSGGFNEISKRYKTDPSIKNYIALRRANPGEVIQVATTGALDYLLAHEETIRDAGIDSRSFAGALDGDDHEQSRVSITLLEKIIERNNLLESGRSHLVSRGDAISDTFVNYVIGCMLDALDWTDNLVISRDLIVLIKHQLSFEESDIKTQMNRRRKVTQARFIAAQILDEGTAPSFRMIAKIMGVQPSTVKRWFPGGNMIEEAKKLSGVGKLIKEIRDLRRPSGQTKESLAERRKD